MVIRLVMCLCTVVIADSQPDVGLVRPGARLPFEGSDAIHEGNESGQWQSTKGNFLKESGYNKYLMILGVILAVASFVTISLLILLLICAVLADLAVPLLALLPSASAAIFAVQIVATAASFEGVPLSLKTVATPLLLAVPITLRPDSVILLSFLLLTAVWLARRSRCASININSRRQIEEMGMKVNKVPHGLCPGAWELRALGFFAFPLTLSSTQLLLRLDEADSPLAGFLLSIVLLSFLLNQAASTWVFVRKVLRDGRVVQTALPHCSGHVSSVFIDKTCDELGSMPMTSGSSACRSISEWMKTPSWCFSHPVAEVEEVYFPEEVVGPLQKDIWDLEGSEDEQTQLLATDLPHQRAEQSFLASSNQSQFGDIFHGGPSPVKVCHPISVRSKRCYGGSQETVAGQSLWGEGIPFFHCSISDRLLIRHWFPVILKGIACLPWLDCAIPSKTPVPQLVVVLLVSVVVCPCSTQLRK